MFLELLFLEVVQLQLEFYGGRLVKGLLDISLLSVAGSCCRVSYFEVALGVRVVDVDVFTQRDGQFMLSWLVHHIFRIEQGLFFEKLVPMFQSLYFLHLMFDGVGALLQLFLQFFVMAV